MDKMREKFEKWFASSRFADIGVGFNRKEDMHEAWQARQPEIDALRKQVNAYQVADDARNKLIEFKAESLAESTINNALHKLESLDSELDANSILTNEIDALHARVAELEKERAETLAQKPAAWQCASDKDTGYKFPQLCAYEPMAYNLRRPLYTKQMPRQKAPE